MRDNAGRSGQVYSVTAGLSYRFNERGWNRTYSQVDVDAYLEAIEILELGLAASVQSEEALAEQLAKQTEATKQAKQEIDKLRSQMKNMRDEEMVVTSSAIFFNINSDQILTRSEASLHLLKQTIMDAPKDQVFHIVGYADADTGTPQYNQALSERRAKAVYDYLIKHGVPESQLKWEGVGSTDNLFPINSNNRVVIVK
jgi:outer membrane protein OmpA-like peptidoglycan-associated protein